MERQQQIDTDNNNSIALEGGSELNGVGQDRAGKAFAAIAEQAKAKYRDTGTRAGEMLASGEIELGAAQIPELMAVPGVEVVGPLPADLQTITIFSVGLATEAREAAAAKAFIQFLSGPRAAPVYKAKGLTCP